MSSADDGSGSSSSSRSRTRRRQGRTLADVELQLVLQWLDASSKLKAAQCSRRLMQAVNHPFAWKDSAPLVVTCLQLASASSASRLLRLIPLSLHLNWQEGPANILIFIVRFPKAAVVRELHILGHGLFDAPWAPLFSSRALQSLQRFVAPYHPHLPAPAMRLLAQLPQLRSMSFTLGYGVDLGPLTAAPQLAHLALQADPHTAFDMQTVGQCLQLRSLRLATPSGYLTGFHVLFTVRPAPEQRLERMELEGFVARRHGKLSLLVVPTADEMCGGLAAMRHLTELRLKEISGVDALLACLHAAPSLRVVELDLEARHSAAYNSQSFIHPSLEVVRALLTRAPQLQVRLLMAPSAAQWMDGLGWIQDAAVRAQMVEQWHELRREFGVIPRISFADPRG